MPQFFSDDYDQDLVAGDPQAGAFVTGFTVGLFAGAAGYFLFATKRGAEIRKQLVSEWEAAQQHLAQQGVVQPGMTLREFLKDLAEKAVHTEQMVVDEVSQTETQNQRRPRLIAHTKKEAAKKFKGV